MSKKNAPGREAEGVVCLLAGDTDANTATALRTQLLLRRHCIRPVLAGTLAGLVFGETAHA